MIKIKKNDYELPKGIPGIRFTYIVLLLLSVGFQAVSLAGVRSPTEWQIISRERDQLYEGSKVFRFIGLAAPNIQQNESQIRLDLTNRFPNEFEIRDILDGLQRVGARATRTFSLSVYHPEDPYPVYISGHRTYNEEAFRSLDLILALAPEYDVRVIIPLIASQQFVGIRGVDEFAALSGKKAGSFWTDQGVKQDFKHFLTFLLNRKNTISGRFYKHDPAILAWQLGNEFGSYASDRKLEPALWEGSILAWSLEMTKFIKQIDKHHLVMDAGGADRQAFIDSPYIDIISEHLYEYWNIKAGKSSDLSAFARDVRLATKGKKPVIIDEFGLAKTENIVRLLKTINEEGISGGLLWSIRGRRRDGGWYYHNEGGTHFNSFHVPGFSVGFLYDESRVLDLIKREAFAIRGLVPSMTKPPSGRPQLLHIKDGFTWRGCAGAESYTIERQEEENTQWIVIASGLHDSVIADVEAFEFSAKAREPLILFYDEFVERGRKYRYRIKAENVGGETAYSEVVDVTWPHQ